MTRRARRAFAFQAPHDRSALNESGQNGPSTCNPHLSDTDRCGIKLARFWPHDLCCLKQHCESMRGNKKQDLCRKHANRFRTLS